MIANSISADHDHYRRFANYTARVSVFGCSNAVCCTWNRCYVRVSSEQKRGREMADQGWVKPVAKAIPKEGYFELERGRYGPTFPRAPACYGVSRSSRRSRKAARRPSGHTARRSRRRLPAVRRCSRLCACTTSAGCAIPVPSSGALAAGTVIPREGFGSGRCRPSRRRRCGRIRPGRWWPH